MTELLDGEIQYVLNDAEFILNSSAINSEGLNDIIYSDGTRTFVLNGRLIQGDNQTVVLQKGDDLSQFYINDGEDEIMVSNEESAAEKSLDESEIVQYVEDEQNENQHPQVVYVNEDGYAIPDSDLSQYEIANVSHENASFPLNAIKLETQIVDLEELIRQQEGNEAIIENLDDDQSYQYAILKDGKLHIQSLNGDEFELNATEIEPRETEERFHALTDEQMLDLSKITGRNLLTGQTVTLHSYMDKLQKKIRGNAANLTATEQLKTSDSNSRKRKRRSQDGLKGLLNKKLTLGKMTNGKRLVGKVIHVENKPQIGKNLTERQEEVNVSAGEDLSADSADLSNFRRALSVDPISVQRENDSGIQDDLNDNLETERQTRLDDPLDDNCNAESVNGIARSKTKAIVQENFVSKECFQQISKTLGGLMNMETVKKKLENKNVVVKVVEKQCNPLTNGYTKQVSYSGGYMEAEYVTNDANEFVQSWVFVPDFNTKRAVFGGEEGEDEMTNEKKFSETTNLTFLVTQEKNNKRVIRVILNPRVGNTCKICNRDFRSDFQLRIHINNAHKTSHKVCEICGEYFENVEALREHRKVHSSEGKFFQCPAARCGKFFLTAGRLKRHSAVHNIALRPLECSVCLHRCSSELGLKKHLMAHMNIKPFRCRTCCKSFTNLGDLNFHKRIHDPHKYYACEICKRTFSRHSNLQRHVEIHKGSGELYQCAICLCSYHYMSSLTRHIVQNHIKKEDSDVTQQIQMVEDLVS